MATGIPGGSSERQRNANRLNFRLEYEGKASHEEILATTAAKLEKVVSVSGNPVNRIIYGDNLHVLKALLSDYEIRGKVRLIYIDPPYATRSRFESRQQNQAYEDTLFGARYLEFLRQRLILMRELLAPDGSIYVHLDENMAFPVKVLMDEIFGPSNFLNWITRKKCNPKNYTRNTYGNISDYIMWYSKTDNYIWNQPFEPWDEESAKREYQYVDEKGRRYKKVPLHAPGVRNGATGQEWRGMKPPTGKHWQYPPSTLDQMDARGEIYWSPNGNPRRKIYLDNSKGIPIQDIWLDFKDAHNQNIRITGYPTEKNPDMLRRIILASSNEDDLVLDAFAGSGTTVAVAEELNRRWIAVDNSFLAIETMVRRLANGTERMGDFVKGNSGQQNYEQGTLFSDGRILRSGLDIYVDVEMRGSMTCSEDQFTEWHALLNSTWQLKDKSVHYSPYPFPGPQSTAQSIRL